MPTALLSMGPKLLGLSPPSSSERLNNASVNTLLFKCAFTPQGNLNIIDSYFYSLSNFAIQSS